MGPPARGLRTNGLWLEPYWSWRFYQVGEDLERAALFLGSFGSFVADDGTEFDIEPRVGVLDQLGGFRVGPFQRSEPADRLALGLDRRVSFFVDRGPVEESHVPFCLHPADSAAAQRFVRSVDCG